MTKFDKILISLFFLLFISGCAELPEFVEKSTTTTSTLESIKFIEKPGLDEDEFVMYVDDEIMVGGKLVILKGILTNGYVTIFVDGIEEVIETTRNPEIVNGLEIITEEIKFGSEKSVHNVKLRIFPLGLQENEYYLRIGDEVEITGLIIKFKDLTNLDGAKILIENQDYLVPLEETLDIRGLEITNKRAFNDAFRNKRSLILQIEALS